MSLPGNIGLLSRMPTPSSSQYGNVDGPSSSTDNALVLWNGTTGRLVKDSDLTYSTPTLSVPSSFEITGQGTLTFSSGSNQSILAIPGGTGAFRVGRATTATFPNGNKFTITGADGDSVFQVFDSYGGSAVTLLRRSEGTLASPTATGSGNMIGIFGFAGYGTDYVTASRASMISVAAETWTNTAQGANLALRTTPVGSTTSAINLTVDPSGFTTVSASTATAGGGSSVAKLVFGTTAGFGIYYGSGNPTVSAAQGSLYLKSNGSGTTDRLWVNNSSGSGTSWTNLISSA